ncbi:MAG: hypothetical protein EPN93_21610 [Spirochaetes bacterium]|nr:MAG: hypothetical protein EPN93_21610 [Spirochaetota bacterium]
MHDLNHELEKSARRVFKLFFGSRLHKQRGDRGICMSECLGVDITMDFHGRKRLSLIVDRSTVESMKERLGARDNYGADADYDIIGEMANIIAGSAVSARDGEVCLSVPRRACLEEGDLPPATMRFSSPMGLFAIAVEPA